MSTSKAKVEALDVEAATADDAGESRPMTGFERDYLAARVVDLEAAIEKVAGSIKGQQETLKTLKSELTEARKAQKGGAE